MANKVFFYSFCRLPSTFPAPCGRFPRDTGATYSVGGPTSRYFHMASSGQASRQSAPKCVG